MHTQDQPQEQLARSIDNEDHRWAVVDRIVASQGFARSPRLSSFLQCICTLAREGSEARINEQYLGTVLFGREPGFDAGIDSIVRSHASRLRHRLDRYFEEEGLAEPWRLVVPKGSYIPSLEPHFDVDPIEETVALAAKSVATPPVTVPALKTPSLFRLSSWWMTLILCVLLCSVVLLRLLRHASESPAAATESSRFWATLFSPGQKSLVVNGDSGLVILQGLTGQRISLMAYLDGSYLRPKPDWKIKAPDLLELGTRRYTSIVDVRIDQNLTALAGSEGKNINFVYSRDLHLDDLKHGNVILLGTYESTPWVQLYEPGMNFYFKNDLQRGEFSVYNRNPTGGEEALYTSSRNDPTNTIYGVVAYRPSLNGTDKVLILEGQSMAGTESAADFVFNNALFEPFLRKIRRTDGTLRFFELLIQSNGMRGEASQLKVVASRIDP